MIWYALATYRAKTGLRTAIVLDGQVYDLAATWRRVSLQDTPPAWLDQPVAALLGTWASVGPELARLAVASHPRRSELTACDPASLAAPFVPARIFGAASNYVEHANEMGTVLAAKADSQPYMFMKSSTSVIGPEEIVFIPPETQQADWEVELGAVIGKRARRVSVANALECVAGYLVVNDISARDLNKRTDYPFKHDWFRGKNHDTFCPIGPWIVPAQLIADPQQVQLKLTVNGDTMQDGTTAEMIWSVREQIAYLSTIVTLLPGDVIATGTPTGVGMGRGIFLKPGDVMVASVAGIGSIRNPVAAERV